MENKLNMASGKLNEDQQNDENRLIRARQEKLRNLKQSGFKYPNDLVPDSTSTLLEEQFAKYTKAELEEINEVRSVAGRVMLVRQMGKASFLTLKDRLGEIQIYLSGKQLGEDCYAEFLANLDRGDIIYCRGSLMKTRRGELTLSAKTCSFLVKSIQTLPRKTFGPGRSRDEIPTKVSGSYGK